MSTEFVRGLPDKIRPSHSVLCVVDMQNDFCSPGGFMDREGRDLTPVREVIPRVVNLMSVARREGVPMVFTQASYGIAGDPYLSPSWLDRAARANPRGAYVQYPVCREGEWGFELIKELDVRDDEAEWRIKKHRYSAFVGTDLDILLRSRGIQTIIFVGVATNVCIESTARDAFMRDYFVVVIEDCCASYTAAEQAGALLNLKSYFGEVASMDMVMAAWPSQSGDMPMRAEG